MLGYQTTYPLMLLALSLPIVGSSVLILSLIAGKKIGRRISGIVSFVTLIASTMLLGVVSFELLRRGQPVYEAYPLGIGTLNGEFKLLSDWLSLPLALAIMFLSSLSCLYSISYMDSLEIVRIEPEMAEYSIAYKKALESPGFAPEREPGVVPSVEAYFSFLLLFAGCMLGLVLSTNLVQFFIFFELLIIPTFFLISIWGSGPCRLIAIKYFLYMVVSGVLLMFGITWIYALAATFDIFSLPALLVGVDQQSALAIAALLFVGFGMKAAIVPFHTWLPDFHAEAPVPIHALLSAVLIKCGVYGIVRIILPCFPLLMREARLFLIVISVITMLWGAMMALTQIQIKRILAYSSINQIGYVILGLASGTELGICGALFHMITHGLAKGMLLLCAGSIIHQSHVRDVDRLGGLAKNMPVTATATLVGGLSIAGTPPLAGFASEWMIFGGVMQAGYLLPAILGLLSTLITIGYYLWTVTRIFFGEEETEFKNVRESPLTMIIPICVGCSLLVLLGVYPEWALQLIHPASELLSQFPV
ncbi:MAG: NADH-quinone oxidoreductase subunit M [Candidatus Bathyarchaeota archaeon]|nr:NADH-quinone oxidoreductase subunit M [Candidatus Bathyarchaeota archaeon]